MKSPWFLLAVLGICVLIIGYDARPIARCGVSLCTIGVITNKEFRLW